MKKSRDSWRRQTKMNNDKMNNDHVIFPLKKWIEPEVRTLDVKETTAAPKAGGDGAPLFPDCAHS
jgi:hypothetical protein